MSNNQSDIFVDIKTMKWFKVYLVYEVGLFLMSVIGNSIVCYVMISKKKLTRPSMKYIFSMAVADLLGGLIGIPVGLMKVRKTLIGHFLSHTQF